MKPSPLRALRFLTAALFALGLAPAAHAQADKWPSRSVTIVSPYNPGGTNDVVARLIAERLQKALGQPFVVENKPGAAGIVGATGVMRAAPDGYTLLSANNGALVVQSVVKTPAPYDPAGGFTPIFKLADAANFLAVSADVPVKTVGELIAYVKQRPGQLNYSSSGSGSFGNFLGEYFKQLTGTFVVHIPGRGSAAALNEMMAGRVHLMIDPQVLTQRNGGRIKVLATTNNARVEGHPDIPTMKESGGPEMAITGWFGLLGPANLPRDVIEKIEAATRDMDKDPEVRRALLASGLVPAPVTGSAFTTLIRDDLSRYSEIQKRAQIVVE
jgi:tripartite-type tricarboxylate transporter receptor subunit TctC